MKKSPPPPIQSSCPNQADLSSRLSVGGGGGVGHDILWTYKDVFILILLKSEEKNKCNSDEPVIMNSAFNIFYGISIPKDKST